MRDDFLELLKRFNKAHVDYVVIGGFASVFYGSTIITQDLDISCDFNAENLIRLSNAISDLKPVYRMTAKKIPFKLTKADSGNLKNLYLDTDMGQLDCVGFVEGLGNFQQVKAASHKVKIQGISCNVLSIEALIKAKKVLGRAKDKQMVLQLEALKHLSNKPHSAEEK